MATITHKQGDTLELTFELKTGTTAVDITNYTITCELPPQTAITSIETRAGY